MILASFFLFIVADFTNALLFIGLQDKIKYSLIGDETAQSFFYINPTTGEISLRKSLLSGTATTYTVSVSYSSIYIVLPPAVGQHILH